MRISCVNNVSDSGEVPGKQGSHSSVVCNNYIFGACFKRLRVGRLENNLAKWSAAWPRGTGLGADGNSV